MSILFSESQVRLLLCRKLDSLHYDFDKTKEFGYEPKHFSIKSILRKIPKISEDCLYLFVYLFILVPVAEPGASLC